MRCICRWTVLAALALALNSCGLPGAVVRSAGRLVEGVGSVAMAGQ